MIHMRREGCLQIKEQNFQPIIICLYFVAQTLLYESIFYQNNIQEIYRNYLNLDFKLLVLEKYIDIRTQHPNQVCTARNLVLVSKFFRESSKTNRVNIFSSQTTTHMHCVILNVKNQSKHSRKKIIFHHFEFSFLKRIQTLNWRHLHFSVLFDSCAFTVEVKNIRGVKFRFIQQLATLSIFLLRSSFNISAKSAKKFFHTSQEDNIFS